jgi:hypothetical protein
MRGSRDEQISGPRQAQQLELRDGGVAVRGILTHMCTALSLREMPSDRTTEVEKPLVSTSDYEYAGTWGQERHSDRTNTWNECVQGMVDPRLRAGNGVFQSEHRSDAVLISHSSVMRFEVMLEACVVIEPPMCCRRHDQVVCPPFASGLEPGDCIRVIGWMMARVRS